MIITRRAAGQPTGMPARPYRTVRYGRTLTGTLRPSLFLFSIRSFALDATFSSSSRADRFFLLASSPSARTTLRPCGFTRRATDVLATERPANGWRVRSRARPSDTRYRRDRRESDFVVLAATRERRIEPRSASNLSNDGMSRTQECGARDAKCIARDISNEYFLE